MKVTHLLYVLFSSSLLQNCCTAKDPVIPRIEAPFGYDILNATSAEIDAVNFRMRMNFCPRDSSTGYQSPVSPIWLDDGRGMFYLKDTTDKPITDCLRGFIKNFEFSRYDLLYLDIGGTSFVVSASADVGIFICHEKKEVLVRSVVAGSGSCSGSELSGSQFSYVLKIPKIPEGYEIKFED